MYGNGDRYWMYVDKVRQSQTSAGGGADIGNRIAVFEKYEKTYFTNY